MPSLNTHTVFVHTSLRAFIPSNNMIIVIHSICDFSKCAHFPNIKGSALADSHEGKQQSYRRPITARDNVQKVVPRLARHCWGCVHIKLYKYAGLSNSKVWSGRATHQAVSPGPETGRVQTSNIWRHWTLPIGAVTRETENLLTLNTSK